VDGSPFKTAAIDESLEIKTRLLTSEGMLKILRFEVEKLLSLVCPSAWKLDLRRVRGENHVRDAT
jgi:hypothetical protein